MSLRRCCLPLSSILFLLLGLATPAMSSPRSHDGGFFLRLSAGGGVASTEIEGDGEKIKIDGPSGDINFAIGAMVAPNLAIHGTVFGWLLSGPDIEFDGGEFDGEKGSLEEDLSLTGIGAGLTYYLDPANVYFSASVGAGELSIEGDGLTITSDTGIMVDVSVGKEWWVSDRWGLGVAGGVVMHSIPDGAVDENWTGTGFAIRFSATMN